MSETLKRCPTPPQLAACLCWRAQQCPSSFPLALAKVDEALQSPSQPSIAVLQPTPNQLRVAESL